MAENLEQSNESRPEGGRAYWRFSLWLIAVCLFIWLVATLVPLALAQVGVSGTILGWPGVFAVAAFGVPLVYLMIIGLYSLIMDRIEREQHTNEESS